MQATQRQAGRSHGCTPGSTQRPGCLAGRARDCAGIIPGSDRMHCQPGSTGSLRFGRMRIVGEAEATGREEGR
jgi:hypothetical protein